jgi:phosphoglycerate dehydrogenase-like enzyme
VLALPHCGNTTEEVYARNAELLRDNIVAAREGTELRHRLC